LIEDSINTSKAKEQPKTRKNAIVEYFDYQIPVTQLKGPKGNLDMQALREMFCRYGLIDA